MCSFLLSFFACCLKLYNQQKQVSSTEKIVNAVYKCSPPSLGIVAALIYVLSKQGSHLVMQRLHVALTQEIVLL